MLGAGSGAPGGVKGSAGPRGSPQSRGLGEGIPEGGQAAAAEPRRPLPYSAAPAHALTDEEDGEGDEEQEDVRHHVERVHEAAVVEDALVHPVGVRVVLAAAEGQGHGGAGRARIGCGWLHAPPRLCPRLLSRPARPAGPRPPPRGPRPAGSPAPPHLSLIHYLWGRGWGWGAAGSPAGPRWTPVPAVAAHAPRCAGGRVVSAPLRACAWKEGEGWARSSLGGRVRGAEERRRVLVGLEWEGAFGVSRVSSPPGSDMWAHLGRAPIDVVRSEGPGGGRVELVPTPSG